MKRILWMCIFYVFMTLYSFPAFAMVATESNAEVCAEKYQKRLEDVTKDGLRMHEANSKSKAKQFFISWLDRIKGDDILVSVEVVDTEEDKFTPAVAGTYEDRKGKDGYGKVDILVISKTDNSTANFQISFVIKADEYTKNDPYDNIKLVNYANSIESVLKEIEKNRISMLDANTPQDVKLYLEKQIPKSEGFKYKVFVSDKPTGVEMFKAAIAGTRQKPKGISGRAVSWVYVWDAKDADDVDRVDFILSRVPIIQVSADIRINPIPYKSNSGGSSSSGGGSSSGSGSSGGGAASSGKVSSSNSIAGPNSISKGSWIPLENGQWNYCDYQGNLYKNIWIEIEDANLNNKNWFRFDENGNMVIGWFKDLSGEIYYLNPVSNGEKGKMLTGWNWIPDKDGIKKCYYFNPISNGKKGQLMVNTVIDGYQVNENGQWIINGVVQTKVE